MKRRAIVLGAAMLASLAWAGWAMTTDPVDDGEALVRPRPRGEFRVALAPRDGGTAPARAGAAPRPPLLELPARPAAPPQARNLFAGYSYEAPRPRAAPPPPEAPRAPPLPFTFTGLLVIDGKPTYLLLEGDATISATIGAQIGEFKLVSAETSRLVFLHGPTGELVPMPISPTGVN